jgi:hypothetical protein
VNNPGQDDRDQLEDSSEDDADGQFVAAPTQELAALQSEIIEAVVEGRRQERDVDRRRRSMAQPNGSVSTECPASPYCSVTEEGAVYERDQAVLSSMY